VANKTKPRGGPNKDDEQTTTAADPAGRRLPLLRLYQASNQRTTNKAINNPTTASMSISYEEALATLQSMFGETWSREDLDTVLRHKQGQ
jgi:hypothetical protein